MTAISRYVNRSLRAETRPAQKLALLATSAAGAVVKASHTERSTARKDCFGAGGPTPQRRKEPPMPGLQFVDTAARASLDEQRKAAAEESQQTLTRPTSPVEKRAEGGREIVGDAPNVNIEQRGSPEREAQLAAQVEKNQEVVQKTLDTMSPAQRARYEEMDARLASHNDNDSRLSLQTMLLQGKLDERTMADLHRLSTSPKAEGLEYPGSDKIFRETVRELANPERINQGERGTCAATVPLIQLALEDPAEYARLVGGLASPEGTVTTKGGVELTRAPGVEHDDTTRSITQRLLAPPLMDAADGVFVSYDNERDQHSLGGLIDMGSGLIAGQAQYLHEILLGRAQQRLGEVSVSPWGGPLMPTIADPSITDVEAQLAQGKVVAVGMQWGDRDANGTIHGNHKVLVTRIYEENGQKYVEYINPWGSRERMKAEAFDERLRNAHA